MNEQEINWICNNHLCESFKTKTFANQCQSCQNKYQQNSHGVWDISPEFKPSGFPLSRCKHLNELEKTHFWFKPRAQLLSKLIKSVCKNPGKKVLEMGTGTGSFFDSFEHNYKVTGIDGHIDFLNFAKQKNPKNQYLHCDLSSIPINDNEFDIVVAMDVLEHVEADKLLKEAHRLTKPDGSLLISVPAFQFLWSQVDVQAGHNLRYTLKTLKKALAKSGWKLKHHTYYQFFLFPVIYLSRKLHAKKTPKTEHKPPKWVNRLFLIINQLEVKFFSSRKLPFGSSLIAIVKKPKHD